MKKAKHPSPTTTATGKNKSIIKQHNNFEHAAIKKKRLIFMFIIGIVGFCLYSNTFSHDYVLDDFSAIKENNIVRQGIHAIPEIFRTSYRQGYLSVKDGLYRPLSLATFAMEWNYFPDKPSLSHFVNVILYSITGMLLFILLCKMLSYSSGRSKNDVTAFIASVLFMAHPLHVEVVANIKSRDAILCFLFVVCSFLAAFHFLKTGKIAYLFIGLLSYFLSLLSKETAITFLALLPLSLHLFTPVTFKKNIMMTSLFCGIALIYLFIRYTVLQGAITNDGVSMADNVIAGAHTFSTHIGTAFYILGLYIEKLVFPNMLSYDYSYEYLAVISLRNILSIISLIFYVAIGVYASYVLIKTFKKHDLSSNNPTDRYILVFGIFFFLITIFLFSNLVLIIGTSMGDRLMYFPSLGFCIVIAVLLRKASLLFSKETDNREILLHLNKAEMGMLSILLLFYSVKTYSRNADWKNNYTLYSHDVKLVPTSVKAHYYLGLELTKKVAESESDPEKKNQIYAAGIQELEKAVEIMPSFGSAYTQMGVTYFRLKNYEKAIENYNKEVALNQADAITLNNIGSVYFEWKKYKEAEENFNQALQMNPRYVDAYINLGSVYGTLHNFNNAIVCFQHAINYAPDNARAYYYLAITYRNMGDKSNAEKYYQIAGRLNPQLIKPK